MAVDLTKLQAATSRAVTVDASGAAMIRGIVGLIRDAIAADDLQDATAINALADGLEAGTTDLAAAIAENTPAAPPA